MRGAAPGAALLTILLTTVATGQAQERPNYRIDAELDAHLERIEGRATIEFTNVSPRPLRGLELHLYANAFANANTTFVQQGGLRLRKVPLSRYGRIELRTLTLTNGGPSLLAGARAGPTEHDHTQLHVPLPEPLAPGARLQLQTEFTVELPSLTARMGQTGGFAMIAQWFPKLARLEPDGRWSQHPYYGLGEFAADFADYELTLRVPAGHTVAAPGERLEARTDGTRRVERYRLARALDLAWAVGRDLKATRGRSGAVALEVYAPAGQQWLARKQLALLAETLPRLSGMLGPYPQGRLVLVLPPPHGRGAAGMEYAGLVVGWPATRRGALDPVSGVVHVVVTCHELAHQWFPMLVASHEALEPVLDEGLAQWLGMHALRDRYGRHGRLQRLVGLPVDLFDVQRVLWARSRVHASSLEPAWSYSLRELGAAVYQRPALLLESIRRSWGPQRFDRALGRYARDNRYRQVTRRDLCRAFDAGYWPGFCQRVLLPGLRGEPVAWTVREVHGASGIERDPDGHVVLDATRSDNLQRTDDDAPQPAWRSRLLFLAQLLLSAVGA